VEAGKGGLFAWLSPLAVHWASGLSTQDLSGSAWTCHGLPGALLELV